MEKSSLSDWQEEELVAINQIIIRCAAKFQNVIDMHSDPNKYGNKVATQLKSNKNFMLSFLVYAIIDYKK